MFSTALIYFSTETKRKWFSLWPVHLADMNIFRTTFSCASLTKFSKKSILFIGIIGSTIFCVKDFVSKSHSLGFVQICILSQYQHGWDRDFELSIDWFYFQPWVLWQQKPKGFRALWLLMIVWTWLGCQIVIDCEIWTAFCNWQSAQSGCEHMCTISFFARQSNNSRTLSTKEFLNFNVSHKYTIMIVLVKPDYRPRDVPKRKRCPLCHHLSGLFQYSEEFLENFTSISMNTWWW